jgi:hypothetical protein
MKSAAILAPVIVAGYSIFGLAADPQPISPPFGDYTVNGQLRAATGTGLFEEGIAVTPGDWGLVDPNSKAVLSVDSSIDWRLSPDLLRSESCGRLAFFDAPSANQPWTAKLVFKDLSERNVKTVHDFAAQKLAATSKPFILILSDPAQESPRVTRAASDAAFQATWREWTSEPGEYRYILTENFVGIEKLAPDGREKRRELINSYLSDCKPLVDTLRKSPMSLLTAQACVHRTDELFAALSTSRVSNDKMTSYQLSWQVQRMELGSQPTLAVIERFDAFQTNLKMAADDTKCTVTVIATKGQNAEIRAAKTDGRYEAIGVSVVTKEMERALYYFQSWRNNVLTGETMAPVDCTGKDQTVQITES